MKMGGVQRTFQNTYYGKHDEKLKMYTFDQSLAFTLYTVHDTALFVLVRMASLFSTIIIDYLMDISVAAHNEWLRIGGQW